MAFNTNLLKSNTAKQIAGGLGGMAIAALLYLAVDQASYLNIKGLLVSTNTISEKAGQVNVNTTNMDEDTKRQLAKNANAVAGQLASSANASSQIAETPIGNNVADRRAKRIFANEVTQAFASAPTYSNDPNKFIPVEQRVAIRAARIANLPAPDFAPQPLGVGEGTSAPALQASAQVTIIDTGSTPQTAQKHAAATTNSGSLPNSGLGLNLLVLLSLACAFFSVKTTLRDRVVALFA